MMPCSHSSCSPSARRSSFFIASRASRAANLPVEANARSCLATALAASLAAAPFSFAASLAALSASLTSFSRRLVSASLSACVVGGRRRRVRQGPARGGGAGQQTGAQEKAVAANRRRGNLHAARCAAMGAGGAAAQSAGVARVLSPHRLAAAPPPNPSSSCMCTRTLRSVHRRSGGQRGAERRARIGARRKKKVPGPRAAREGPFLGEALLCCGCVHCCSSRVRAAGLDEAAARGGGTLLCPTLPSRFPPPLGLSLCVHNFYSPMRAGAPSPFTEASACRAPPARCPAR